MSESIACATYPGNTARATKIYGEVFRKGFEFIYGERIPGAVAEFGTYQGFTALLIADLLREFLDDEENYGDQDRRDLYVFDSFQGFPESHNEIDTESPAVAGIGAWSEGMDASPPGTEEMLRRELRRRLGEDNWKVVKGFYEDTVRLSNLGGPLALVNLDCDLYASTYTILDHLMTHELLPDGALLFFDDYNCNRANPRYGQRRVVLDLATKYPEYELEPWQNYGWHGRAFVVHH